MSRATSGGDSGTRPLSEPSRKELVHEIVSAVAETNECGMFDLQPLSTVVDPEAIESLLANPNVTVDIQFEYAGGEVCVTDSGVEFEPESQ